MPRGGRRPGAGRPRKPIAQHRRHRTRPHYPTRPKAAPDAPSHSPTRPFWVYPRYGLLLDPHELTAAVDEVWDDELEAAWPPEVYPHSAALMTSRQVAKLAVWQFAEQWWREAGPEWAASEGIPGEAIVETWRRPPDPHAELYRPPDAEQVRELLRSGWLRRWWASTASGT